MIINEFEKKQLLEAEEIFKNYNGSHFGMGHDGVYDRYKKFNIPEEQEQLWLQELCNDFYKNLDKQNESTYFKICTCAENLKDISLVKEIIKYPFTRTLKNNYVDTLFMLKYSFNLIDRKKKYLSFDELQNIKNYYDYWMKKFQVDILKAIKNNEFKFDSYYFMEFDIIEKYLNEQKNKLHEIKK